MTPSRPVFSMSQLLIGPPLETDALVHQAVSKGIGLAVFASDALSSTAYATEEILLILALAGAGALHLSLPVALAIASLLVIVTISYRQTIYAYPNGGGAYIVARDNLGEVAAVTAGVALLMDYILTVAVSISSGVAQIASAFPGLHKYRPELAIGVIVIMTIVNLRGVKESGTIFAVPTYFFLAMMFLTLGVGAFRAFNGTLGTVTGLEPLRESLEPITLFLILRAFSSGCTALTGIEAISNGITAFKPPRSRNAATTLTWMSTILITLFIGITLLSRRIGALPVHDETVISQLARTIYSSGSILYIMTVAGTALILLMAANTSYADFPRLAALQARDGFLPRQLGFRGSRLVFSWGIIALATLASLLVIFSGAQVSVLIPLYAVGVFMSFTLSQAGMAVRMWREGHLQPGQTQKGLETDLKYDPNWRQKMIVSGFGALCTGIVMIVFAVTKFISGAWLIVILLPTLVYVFFRIHKHYAAVANSLRLNGNTRPVESHPMETIILVDNVHAGALEMVDVAKSLGKPWQAIHIATNPEKAEHLREQWEKYIGEGELKIIESPYRHLTYPLREYIEGLLDQHPESYVHVIMGHLAMDTFMGQVLHQNSVLLFNVALTNMDRVVVTIVPYQIHRVPGNKNEYMSRGTFTKQLAARAAAAADHASGSHAEDSLASPP